MCIAWFAVVGMYEVKNNGMGTNELKINLMPMYMYTYREKTWENFSFFDSKKLKCIHVRNFMSYKKLH
jgi:hypothetical protein